MGTSDSLQGIFQLQGHGSYLQGMETFPFINTAFQLHSTDPTYKEWKQSWSQKVTDPTRRRTDPTYKEWKRFRDGDRDIAAQSARILPTRNGNAFRLSRDAFQVTRTDPTYKEWKLTGVSFGPTSFGARILPTRNGNP